MARSLGQLQREFKQQINSSLASSAKHTLATDDITEWNFGELPKEVVLRRGDMKIKAWPTLRDHRQSVSIEVLDDPLVAESVALDGQLRLAVLKGQEQSK